MSGAGPAPAPAPAPAGLAGRLLAGDRAALARALSLVERRDPAAAAVLAAARPHAGRSAVVGVTGAPGAGKSTLVSGLAAALRARGERVAVLAVDPSSPISGGALLGDRVRMGAHTRDPGVFVRSLASREGSGGLAPGAADAVTLMEAAGFGTVLVETVGAGQSEVAVADLAPVRVVVLAPGLGDEVQALKSGILDIADVLVVNKADLPGTDALWRATGQAIAMRPEAARPALVRAAAAAGDGVGAVLAAVDARGAGRERGPDEVLARTARLLAGRAADDVRARLRAGGAPALDDLARAVLAGETDLESAAARLVDGWLGRGGVRRRSGA